MDNTLRERRTAVDWASESQVIEITEKISSFDGLVDVLDADLAALDLSAVQREWRDNEVVGTLRFGIAGANSTIATLEGQIQATVLTVCQRCLEPFSLALRIEPQLLLLAIDETADDLVEKLAEYEVWELDDKQLRPAELVEEMLIMALPFAAKHDNVDECAALAATSSSVVVERREDMKKPFATLRSQMTQSEKDPTN